MQHIEFQFLNVKKATNDLSDEDSILSCDLNSDDSVLSCLSDSSSTSRPTSTTPFVPRSVLEDFDNCGVKGSSNRVIGGSEVIRIINFYLQSRNTDVYRVFTKKYIF